MKKFSAALALILIMMLGASGCNSDMSFEVTSSNDQVASVSTESTADKSTSFQQGVPESMPASLETSSASTAVLSDGGQSQSTQDSDQNSGSSEPANSENEQILPSETTSVEVNEPVISSEPYTRDTRISDVISDPVFGDYGRLIFPVDEGYYSGETLGELRLTWYNNIDPDKTVEIANYMRSHAESGDVIFYDIYSDSEKAADPWKKDTGLFFFKGTPGEKFAVCSAGGGFAFVGGNAR